VHYCQVQIEKGSSAVQSKTSLHGASLNKYKAAEFKKIIIQEEMKLDEYPIIS
jgi:hypothetical protein